MILFPLYIISKVLPSWSARKLPEFLEEAQIWLPHRSVTPGPRYLPDIGYKKEVVLSKEREEIGCCEFEMNCKPKLEGNVALNQHPKLLFTEPQVYM